MKGADNPPEKKDIGRKQDGGGCQVGLEQAHTHEQESNNDSGKNLEKAFNPEMHNPPSPVFGNGQIGLASPHQAGTVKKCYRSTGDNKHAEQMLALRFCFKGRKNRSDHQQQPEE